MLELFESWGYWGMLVAAFVAGSVFPFSSEAVLTALQLAGLEPVRLFVFATVGNTAGSMLNYAVGTLGRMEWIEKYLHVKREKVERANRWLERYGAWIGLFAFLPISGSVIAVVLGVARVNPWLSTLTIFLGKAARYALLVFVVAQF